MISFIMQVLFKLQFSPILVSKKKQQQRIYGLLNLDTKLKNSEIIGIFYGLYQAQTFSPLITIYGAFLKRNKYFFPSTY